MVNYRNVLVASLLMALSLVASGIGPAMAQTGTPQVGGTPQAGGTPMACATPSGGLGSFRVGYSAAGLIDAVQIAWSESIGQVVKDAGGEVVVVDSQNDIAKQNSDIEDLLSQRIDYLVVNPVDEAGIVPAIEAANAEGIPVVTIDRKAGGGKVATHVGFDNYRAGYEAGTFIAEQNGGKGKVAQLEGQAGQSVVRERSQGFRDAIAEYPDMEIVFERPTDWDTAKAAAATEDLLQAQPDVVGIWAHADAIIMGAIEALMAEQLNDKVVTVGMGMYGGGPEAIAAGELDASWELYPAELGAVAAQAVVALQAGCTVEANINTRITFVTKDNIDAFLKQ